MAEEKMKGIDVSYWQGTPNEEGYKKFKEAGWDFIIARIGYADGGIRIEDSTFDYNEKQCRKQNLKFGAYYYSNAKSAQDGRNDAAYVLKLLKGRKLDLPMWIDIEDNITSGTASKTSLAEAGKAFCQTMEKAGYLAGVYASAYWFKSKIGDLGNLRKWCAQYNDTLTYSEKVDMWQYSNTGTVPGFDRSRDVNHCYVAYQEEKLYSSIFPELPSRGFFLKGDKGLQVEKLQRLLNRTTDAKVKIDGTIGKETILAIKAYQKKYGLITDGIFGIKSVGKSKSI